VLSTPRVTSIELGLGRRIATDARFRKRYLQRWASNEVATELRSMRKRRRLLQAALAAKAGTGQSAISRIEKQNYDGWTFKTLFSIALALDARLRIQLEPIEDVIRSLQQRESATAYEHRLEAIGTTDASVMGEDLTDPSILRNGSTEFGDGILAACDTFV
jgi:transcriptional regulator with XRE-family HTH domain